MFEKIRILRLSKNMTQKQLADLLGTTQQNISNYENHKSTPGYDIIIKMADLFQVTADFIIRDDIPPSCTEY